MGGDQLVEPADAFDPLGHPAGGEPLAGPVLDEHVMVTFGPVMTHEHLRHPHPLVVPDVEPEATSSSR